MIDAIIDRRDLLTTCRVIVLSYMLFHKQSMKGAITLTCVPCILFNPRIYQDHTTKYWKTFYTKYSSLVYETTWNTFWITFREKSESNPHILKDDFRRLQSRYKNYQQVYTDGSKEDSKVGCAVISDNHSYMQRVPDDSSIFTVEAKNSWFSFRLYNNSWH